LLRAPPSAAMNSRLISLYGILPAKHVDLLAQDQILRFQPYSRLNRDARAPRISWNTSTIRQQAYRVSTSRLAKSNFRYTHDPSSRAQ
jgi:hypothetical protein